MVGAPQSTRDITKRSKSAKRNRQLTAEAATANAKFRAFFEQGPLFVGIMSMDGTIIDLKRAESQRNDLLQAERTARTVADGESLLKDEYLATLSHELRTTKFLPRKFAFRETHEQFHL